MKLSISEDKIEPLINLEQAAELLQRSHWTLRQDVKAGHLRCVRLGRRILFEPNEIRRVIAQGFRTPPQDGSDGHN